MQAFANECVTLTGLRGLQHLRCLYVCAGQTLLLVTGAAEPAVPLDELHAAGTDTTNHTHARALLLATATANTEPGARVFLLCARCFVGHRATAACSEPVRRPLVWELTRAPAWRPLRLRTTTGVQRGLVVSAWEVVEELLRACCPAAASPFAVDLPALRALPAPRAQAVACGALANFLWEVWSVGASSRAYAPALWSDISALCELHFDALSRVSSGSTSSATSCGVHPPVDVQDELPC